jgi:hypothetical protein
MGEQTQSRTRLARAVGPSEQVQPLVATHHPRGCMAGDRLPAAGDQGRPRANRGGDQGCPHEQVALVRAVTTSAFLNAHSN